MCKIFDKAKAEEASDIVKRLYDAYLVGRVEVYLVQPTDLLQVQENEPSQEPDGDNENNNEEASEQKESKESHNAVKFSDAPVEKEEEEDDADKPLVSFDILIDPGLYARKFKKKVVEEK